MQQVWQQNLNGQFERLWNDVRTSYKQASMFYDVHQNLNLAQVGLSFNELCEVLNTGNLLCMEVMMSVSKLALNE